MHSEDASKLIEEGIALIEQGKYEEALLYFDKSLALEPGNLSALYTKGSALSSLGRYEEATYILIKSYL